MQKNKYGIFLLMLLLSFIIMYAVMFLNVASVDHIDLSITRLYMAILMVSPMAILMLIFMGKMYSNKTVNAVILVGSIGVFLISFVFLRNQTFIDDEDYMRAMIPHHSSAILTSQQATFTNPAVQELADDIIATQIREIELMRELMAEMKN